MAEWGPAMSTYSFQDVTATITGVGGSFSLASGSGAAEEGISIEYAEDKDAMTIGADGTAMHSLHAGKGGTVTVRILKTSPVNSQLSIMYNAQTVSSTLHGNNVISVRNSANGDTILCRSVAFKKFPNMSYAKDGGTVEWAFNVGMIDTILGEY